MTNEQRIQYDKQRYLNDKERLKEYAKSRKKDHPDKIRKIQRRCDLNRRYGISTEQYNQILLKQNGCCAICERHSSEFKRKLSVDHNHTSGKIRGLLCLKCNTKIGHIETAIPFLDKITEYLRASV